MTAFSMPEVALFASNRNGRVHRLHLSLRGGGCGGSKAAAEEGSTTPAAALFIQDLDGPSPNSDNPEARLLAAEDFIEESPQREAQQQV